MTFHVLRHTHASTLAMRGMPMAVIARQLSHPDPRMTEKHYAHLAPNYVADTIRAKFPKLGIAEAPSVVVSLRARPSEGSELTVRPPSYIDRLFDAIGRWRTRKKGHRATSFWE
jgi:hypothetical protein